MKELFNWRWLKIAIIAILSSCAFTSCGDDDKDEPKSSDPSELIVGKWVCYNDAYGESWGDEPFVLQFNSDGSGYGLLQEDTYVDHWKFTYIVTSSKILVNEYDEYNDSWFRYDLRYEMSTNGKSLVLYGFDDDDMSELHFIKK